MRIVRELGPIEVSEPFKERLPESVGVWSLRYGALPDATDHIGAYFGMIPISIAQMWLWADFKDSYFPLSEIRSGRREFEKLMASRPYDLFAGADCLKNQKFLTWLGFRPIGATSQELLYRR